MIEIKVFEVPKEIYIDIQKVMKSNSVGKEFKVNKTNLIIDTGLFLDYMLFKMPTLQHIPQLTIFGMQLTSQYKFLQLKQK